MGVLVCIIFMQAYITTCKFHQIYAFSHTQQVLICVCLATSCFNRKCKLQLLNDVALLFSWIIFLFEPSLCWKQAIRQKHIRLLKGSLLWWFQMLETLGCLSHLEVHGWFRPFPYSKHVLAPLGNYLIGVVYETVSCQLELGPLGEPSYRCST